ncbi:hypothetical protein SADUNF_Sadunf19G0087500 [Salix dunnii]|uniref:Uncharacterized protein n=1 Tax=Salix dunnii TaxID=1413687 RepID=A0A835J1V5_9ROSI|nr:hypothetical protein SADUNF_Sadunf19G0087500 [Salix dunnii]
MQSYTVDGHHQTGIWALYEILAICDREENEASFCLYEMDTEGEDVREGDPTKRDEEVWRLCWQDFSITLDIIRCISTGADPCLPLFNLIYHMISVLHMCSDD